MPKRTARRKHAKVAPATRANAARTGKAEITPTRKASAAASEASSNPLADYQDKVAGASERIAAMARARAKLTRDYTANGWPGGQPDLARAAMPGGRTPPAPKQAGEVVDIAYERFGDPDAPPVLLVMGLGAQMLGWHDEFCELLVKRGLHVIRFDNRDVGESTHLDDAPRPNVMAAMAGDTSSVSYTLSDMAADTAGLLDALELDSAHVVGASMGGMIAQTLAIGHPERVRSLTSIMSSTSDSTVGQAARKAVKAMAAKPPRTREEAMDRAVAVFRVIGSPGFPLDERDVRERAGVAYDRGADHVGVARQLAAALSAPDRTADLRSVEVPALVLHGAADPLVDVSGAHATAEALPNAELVIIDGMGHDLPRELWDEVADRIADLIDGVEVGRATGNSR